MNRKLMNSVVWVLGVVAFVVMVIWIVIAQPSFRQNHFSKAAANPVKLREHVETLSQRFFPRDWQHRDNLDQCADYIARHFKQAGAAVEFQSFTVGKSQYRNVVGRFNVGKGRRVIVGAHYDAYGEFPGADDNASGVAALIELASLVGHNTLTNPVELVAYVLEEPPFFRSDYMGSAVHAKSLERNGEDIRGVIVLEMVGYFSDEWGSQGYPAPILRLIYPNRGNFIGVVGRWDQGDWIKTLKVGMKGVTDLPVYSIRAPALIPGIDFSDHMNYWPSGVKAIMVTDTAFYRNKVYHLADDTADRLDYNRMAKVVVAVYEAIAAQ